MHADHLLTVLRIIGNHSFYVKANKCSFGCSCISYLGHFITEGVLKPDPDKISAMVAWPTPSSVKQLRGFLGLTGYYRRFIAGYASIAAPLTDLLKKDSFVWTPSAEDSFTRLKAAMTSAPVLRLPDFTQPFYLETDASSFGIGAVLMQNGHPLAFFSKKLAADALSRRDEEEDLAGLFMALVQPLPLLMRDLRLENQSLPELQDLHAAVTAGTASPDFSVHDGLLYFKRRLYLGRTSSLHSALLEEFHSTPAAGHQGRERTFRRLAQVFSWPGMRADVRRFVASCAICQSTKYSTQKPGGLLQPLPVPVQTDGQTEVLNRNLEQYLRAFVSERPTKWSVFLSWAELALNCGHHEGLGLSPFQALYGRPPPSVFPTIAVRSRVPEVEEMLRERADLLTDLRGHLIQMQQRMRSQANQHRREVSFTVGDLVLLKLRPYCQHSVARPLSAKLARRYYGPFEVLEKLGAVAYRLRLPDGCRIHDVFHVSLLKPFVGRPGDTPQVSLPAQFFKGRPVATPVAAVDRRTVMVDGALQEQWRVKWSEGSNDDTTWEPKDDLVRHFPDLRLEDKDVLNGGGVDTGAMAPPGGNGAGSDRPRRQVRPPRRYDDYV
ncbi:unnamed protein product [Cuscuta campestris]|uniref:Chromo domain-containing protein n=1 Tax=Cuscuta campestris TaxID=132261 RepID=A0A484LN05_9ASTE|nr:unnamed protein product [Cuscuta campestris]